MLLHLNPSYLVFMGTEVRCGDRQHSGDGESEDCAALHCKATKLHTYKWLPWHVFCCVYFTTMKKLKKKYEILTHAATWMKLEGTD